MPGATRAAIAQDHEKDLELSSKYGVSFLTYWFDEDRSTAFCLVDAGTPDAVTAVHGEAHGMIPNEIIPVDTGMVEAFLGRIADPPGPTGGSGVGRAGSVDSAFRVIMFTDLEDSTAMTQRLGDKRAMDLLRIHNTLTRTALHDHDGREVKHLGDGVMASFGTADNAVDGAVAIQKAFSSYNDQQADEVMKVRIGISAGEPVEEDGDLFGTAVQLASRLCAAAEPDQILVARAVVDISRADGRIFADHGEMTLKGFQEPVRVFDLRWI